MCTEMELAETANLHSKGARTEIRSKRHQQVRPCQQTGASATNFCSKEKGSSHREGESETERSKDSQAAVLFILHTKPLSIANPLNF